MGSGGAWQNFVYATEFYFYFIQRVKVVNMDHIGLQRFNPIKSNRISLLLKNKEIPQY